MKVTLADGSGFCFGVKRAMEMAFKYAADNKKKRLYSFHEIIHNPQENAKLKKTGAMQTDSIADIANGASVIISTHGVTKTEEALLNERCGSILDTTCPYVKKIHRIVEKLTEEDYRVVIVGDSEHLEVKGILGHAAGKGCVVSSLEESALLKLGEKTGVVAQTTQNLEIYNAVICEIQKRAFLNRYAEVRVFNTICDATKNRQQATLGLAKKTDVMIIVGGKNSANTRRLFEISCGVMTDVYHVESASEIRKIWFKGKKSAGISAGASTPADVIAAVVSKIRKIGENK
jgi:4-hydroxy-3-methylbut-2-enyl diphosphate reductase